MFFFRDGLVAVLLLVLTQSLVCASFKDEKNTTEALAKVIIGSMQVPWADRMDSLIRSSETSCAEEITAMSEAFMAQETWAMHMLDASSKLQSGILMGNFRDLGMYDQCVNAKGQYNGTYVQGKHCTVSLGMISSAVCFPSSCNETEVVEVLEAVIQIITETIGFGLEISGATCVPVGSVDFTVGEILTICFFVAVVAFMIFCTFCELVKYCRPAGVPSVINELVKFSLYKNAITLLSTESNPRMMPAIQGIRFISTCWIVLGHTHLNRITMPMVNALDIVDWYNSWTAIYVQAAPFAVDTFFVISGFLMCYLFLKSKQSGKKSNFLMMYLHRYLRLTPCVAVLMLFVAVLLHRVANGPLWDTIYSGEIEFCRKNWWVNLLYVQNFVRYEEACIGHTWYLAVDMQLFWISPFILYPLHRWPKRGLGILGLFLIASVVVPVAVLWVNGYSNALVSSNSTPSSVFENMSKFYVPTYTRGFAYFLGILMGYDAANAGKRNFTKVFVAIGWVVACIFILLCLLATQRLYHRELDYDLALEILFAITLRPFWSIAMAWIVYACTFGYGGPVTRILSLPIFLPLSRLSYCIYLVHMVIQHTKNAAAQTPGRFTDFIVINDFWADLVLSIAVAFIFSLLFESPIIVLEKMLTNRGRNQNLAKGPKTDVEGGIENKGMTKT